jgi:hypothetical protein
VPLVYQILPITPTSLQPPPPRLAAGQELILLHEALPGKRNIIGVDLAPGMVQVAQQLIGCAAGQAAALSLGPWHADGVTV